MSILQFVTPDLKIRIFSIVRIDRFQRCNLDTRCWKKDEME
jgi:hypothetical protein